MAITGSIDTYFPLQFQNGFRVSTLGFWCLQCSAVLPLSSVQGQVSMIIKEVVDITATALCSCGCVNRYRIRLHDDGSISYLKDGRWVRKNEKLKISILYRIKIFLNLLKLRFHLLRLKHSLRKLQKTMNKEGTANHAGRPPPLPPAS